MEFLSQYGLLILLGALLVFMFLSQRRRTARLKAEQEAKARQTVPGAGVLLQGGIHGTIVSYDPDNLDQPAEIEIAPGTVIRVHSQAILRVTDPAPGTEEFKDIEGFGAPAIESINDEPRIEADAIDVSKPDSVDPGAEAGTEPGTDSGKKTED